MHRYGHLLKTVFDRALATVLLIVLPFAATGVPARSTPPPPRFVPVSSSVHVVAAWEGQALLNARLPGSVAAATDHAFGVLSKTAGAAAFAPDGTLHYSISVTNATVLTRTYRLTDTLSANASYVSATATGGLVYNAASTNLTASVTLSPFHGDVITTTGAPPYVEISGTIGAQNICQQYFPDCDDNAITLGGVPFRYLGVDYTTITLDSNGFVAPGSANPGLGNQNQHLPDPAAPNNVIAPFWDDLDLNGASPTDPGGGDWYYGVEQSNVDYLVVEWHNAQKKSVPGTAYSFQIWIQLHAEHITFAYQVLTGDTSSATVGFEDGSGTLGHSYLFDGAGTVPAPGDELQLVGNFDTARLGYDARAHHGLPDCSLITNTVNLSNGPGSITASAVVTTPLKGPCLFLPFIAR
jgi:uncharacterized repeat protein (TIGR01451 family)